MSRPTLAEVVVRLDEVVRRLNELAASLEAGYVRKDVYRADRTAGALQVKSLEDDLHLLGRRVEGHEERHRTDTWARWSLIVSSLVGPVLVVVVLRLMGLVGG